VWRREVITTPAGHRDAETRVYWLQTRSWYGDIRIPATRPARADTGFMAYGAEELFELAGMQGFAGRLTADETTCVWRRDLDFQPPASSPDEGTYELDGSTMIERGVHADYEEIWRLEPASRGLLLAFQLEAVSAMGARGLLLIAGDHFLSIVERPTPLPPGENLKSVLTAALAQGGLRAAVALLDMPIAYGRIASGAVPWEVTLSTWPWLERRGFWEGAEVDFDPVAGVLRQTAQGRAKSWSLLDNSEPPGEIARHLHLPDA
jgi:hypothetical protein